MIQNKSYSVNELMSLHKIAQDLSFTSHVDDVEIYPKPKDVDFIEAKAQVFWTLYMDARDYGVKDMSPSISKIHIIGTYEYAVDVDEEEKTEDFELTITGKDWHIKEDFSGSKISHGLFPTLVHVDPKTKQVTVDFY